MHQARTDAVAEEQLRALPVRPWTLEVHAVNDSDLSHTKEHNPVLRSLSMGRLLVRMADGSGFTLAGKRLENGSPIELQVAGDLWVPGAFAWSPNLGSAILFTFALGGPHERDGTQAPEVSVRLDPAEAYFRYPAGRSN
jgi:hypothetical protein